MALDPRDPTKGWRAMPGGIASLSKKFGGMENTNLYQKERLLESIDAMEPGEFFLPVDHRPVDDPYDQPNASMDIALNAENKGFRMLMKMGWKESTGLGKDGSGIVDPIRIKTDDVQLGLGKAEEIDAMTEETTEMRRKLEAEIQASEDGERRQKREQKAEKLEKITEQIKDVTRAFFCDICKKQYTNVRQFDEHLQSMDHHHKKRLVELHQDMKGSAEEREKDRLERQKKEQAKADKEMKALLKIQQEQLARQAARSMPPNPAPPPMDDPSMPLGGYQPMQVAQPVTMSGPVKMQLGGFKPRPGLPPAKRPCVFQDDDD